MSDLLDVGRIPFSKAFPFLASVLPGFTIIFLYESSHTGTMEQFISMSLLGYKTKLTLIVIVAFLLGYSLNKLLAAVFGAFGGVVGGSSFSWLGKDPFNISVAPWRDKRWRAAYARRFEGDAPADLSLTPDDAGRKLKYEGPDSAELERFAADAFQVVTERVLNDEEWRSRYLRLHLEALTKTGREFADEIGAGLDSNLTISALVLVISSWVMPQVRIWWLLLLAYMWFGQSLLITVYKTTRFFDPWSTFRSQMDFLNSRS